VTYRSRESAAPKMGFTLARKAVGVPLIGTAAAVCLILFFVGAIITHLRARDYSFGLAVVFLLLAVATLVLRVALS
jgi:hypothetical protein